MLLLHQGGFPEAFQDWSGTRDLHPAIPPSKGGGALSRPVPGRRARNRTERHRSSIGHGGISSAPRPRGRALVISSNFWSGRPESNWRSPAPEAGGLPSYPTPGYGKRLVTARGFEPPRVALERCPTGPQPVASAGSATPSWWWSVRESNPRLLGVSEAVCR